MLGRWYKIVGITEDLLKAWSDDLREDLIIYKENDEVQARIRLTWLEALKMKYQMARNNMTQPYVLKLVKDR